LCIALFLLPIVANAQVGIPGAPVQAQAQLSVENATLKILVYPDGAIRPVYSAQAILEAAQPGLLPENLSVTAVMKSKIDRNESYTLLSVRASILLGNESFREEQKAVGGLYGVSDFSSGNGVFSLVGNLSLFKGGLQSFLVDIKAINITQRDTYYLTLVVKLHIEGVKKQYTVPSLEEVRGQLASMGITYIDIKELYVQQKGDIIDVSIVVDINIDEMLKKAVEQGMSQDDVRRVRSLLEEPYSIRGNIRGSLEYYAAGRRIEFSLDYESKMTGDVEKSIKITSELGQFTPQILAALLAPFAKQNPELQIAIMQMGATSMKPTTIVPPSKSEFKLTISTITPSQKARIEISYEGHRTRILGEGDPGRLAEKTLMVYADSFQQLVNNIVLLDIVVPGASSLVPTLVTLEPASPTVAISQSRISFNKLATVNVKITAVTPPPPPPTTPETTTTTPRETKTTTIQTPTTKTQPEQTQSTTAPTTTTTQGAQTTQTETAKGEVPVLVIAGIVAVFVIVAIIVGVMLRR
jgi:hypothetical protein